MPKKPSRTTIKKKLQTAINDLVNAAACTFWACPGPNNPHVDMATCRVCTVIKDLRKTRDDL